MSVQQRRKYVSDFKRNAVQLSEEPGRSVAGVADNLGIGKDILCQDSSCKCNSRVMSRKTIHQVF